jgi:hypothetical protein
VNLFALQLTIDGIDVGTLSDGANNALSVLVVSAPDAAVGTITIPSPDGSLSVAYSSVASVLKEEVQSALDALYGTVGTDPVVHNAQAFVMSTLTDESLHATTTRIGIVLQNDAIGTNLASLRVNDFLDVGNLTLSSGTAYLSSLGSPLRLLFAGLSESASEVTDPRVVFDPTWGTDGRWIMSEMVVRVDSKTQSIAGGGQIFLAVSDTSDPTGGWTALQIDPDPLRKYGADFPTLGVNEDGVYLSVDLLDGPGGPEDNTTTIISVPRSDLDVTGPQHPKLDNISILTPYGVSNVQDNPLPFTQPVIDFGSSANSEPLLTTGLIRSDIVGNALGQQETPTGFDPTPAVLSASQPPYGPMLQNGGPLIETGGNKFQTAAYKVGNYIWIAFGTDDNGRAAVRWVELTSDSKASDSTPTSVVQTGIISDSKLDLYYPSIAVNSSGDIVIGFTGSSDTQYPSAYAKVGHVNASDPTDVTFGAITLLQQGNGDYKVFPRTHGSRWGDYSSMVPDPVVPHHFWSFQEYTSKEDEWAINVTEINADPSIATTLRPFVQDDVFTTNDETTLASTTSVLANDRDLNSVPLTLSARLTLQPAHGTLTFNSDGTFAYKPYTSFYGTDFFEYQAVNADNSSMPATVTINVLNVNDAPSGEDNTVGPIGDQAVYTFSATDFGFSDDSDIPPNALLAVKIVSLPSVGTLSNNAVAISAGDSISAADLAAGAFRFTAPTLFATTATFNFQVQDDGGTDNSGTDLDPTQRTMMILHENHPPLASNESYNDNANTTLTISNPSLGVLKHATDADGDSITVAAVMGSSTTATITPSSPATVATDNGSVTLYSDGHFTYTPGSGFTGIDTFKYNVGDGQSSNNLSSFATVAINVTNTTIAPTGADNTVGGPSNLFYENHTYTFLAGDFQFSDANSPANTFVAVKITTVPALGTLTFQGAAITQSQINAGYFVQVGNITSGDFRFTPAADTYSIGATVYSSFNFQVQSSATTNNLDLTAKTMKFIVTRLNHEPMGHDNTINISRTAPYQFTAADFGFSDPNDSPSNNLKAIKISSLPVAGSLLFNGTPITQAQVNADYRVLSTDLAAGKLAYAVPTGKSALASFMFQVQDDGGTGGAGVDLDQQPNTMTLFHSPVGMDKVINIGPNVSYAFAVADFGYSDPGDNPADPFGAVKIATLPAAGTLKDNGVLVVSGQTIPVADINAGKLVFTPATGAGFSLPYAYFTFSVVDSSGDVSQKVDSTTGQLVPATWKITINVVPSVGGTVYSDNNNNGTIDTGELKIQGVAIHLFGMTSNGDAVNLTTITDVNGQYLFAGIKPGSYTVSEDQPYAIREASNGSNSLSVALTLTSGSSLNNNFSEGGIDTRTPAQGGVLQDVSGLKQELLASTPSSGIRIATGPTNPDLWDSVLTGWDNLQSVQLALSSNLAYATLTVTDKQGNVRVLRIYQDPRNNHGTLSDGTITPPTGSTARFFIDAVGTNGQYIVRVCGTAAQFGLNLLG